MRAIWACVLVGISGCGLPPPSHDIVARITAPDGQIDASVIESNGGETTSFWYDICFAPRGGTRTTKDSAAMLYGAGRNDYAYAINVRWESTNILIVEYQSAIRTKVAESAISTSGQPIHNQLRPGVADLDAPPGSMLENVKLL